MMLLKSVDELADIVASFDAAKAFLSEEQGGGSPTQHHRGSASVSRGLSKIGWAKQLSIKFVERRSHYPLPKSR
jgi:hypothetical protein